MAGRNTLKLDTSGFSKILTEIEALGGNVEKVTEKELKQAAVRIMNDTIAATSAAHLPARGKYSIGLTRESVIHWPRVEWEGLTAWVPVGFDFSLAGAGGFLISGTPRMEPDKELHKMYKQKRYMSGIQKGMLEGAWNEMLALMKGNS